MHEKLIPLWNQMVFGTPLEGPLPECSANELACLFPQLSEFDLQDLLKAMKEQPDEIHWPTPDDPVLHYPTVKNLIVKQRRRNFVVSPESKP